MHEALKAVWTAGMYLGGLASLGTVFYLLAARLHHRFTIPANKGEPRQSLGYQLVTDLPLGIYLLLIVTLAYFGASFLYVAVNGPVRMTDPGDPTPVAPRFD